MSTSNRVKSSVLSSFFSSARQNSSGELWYTSYPLSSLPHVGLLDQESTQRSLKVVRFPFEDVEASRFCSPSNPRTSLGLFYLHPLGLLVVASRTLLRYIVVFIRLASISVHASAAFYVLTVRLSTRLTGKILTVYDEKLRVRYTSVVTHVGLRLALF